MCQSSSIEEKRMSSSEVQGEEDVQEIGYEYWDNKLRTTERLQSGLECLMTKRYDQSQWNREESYDNRKKEKLKENVCQELSATLKESLWISQKKPEGIVSTKESSKTKQDRLKSHKGTTKEQMEIYIQDYGIRISDMKRFSADQQEMKVYK